MPLKQQFRPQVSLIREMAQSLELTVAAPLEAVSKGPLNLVIIADHAHLAEVAAQVSSADQGVALVSTAGRIHLDFHGRTEEYPVAAPNLTPALRTAARLLQGRTGRHKRVLLLPEALPSSRLDFQLTLEDLAGRDIAFDVATDNSQEYWAESTAQTFGQVLPLQPEVGSILHSYLEDWSTAAVPGCEVRLHGLVGVGRHWQAGRTTLPPVAAGSTCTLRLRAPQQPGWLFSSSVEVRFLGLGYSEVLSLPAGDPAGRVA